MKEILIVYIDGLKSFPEAPFVKVKFIKQRNDFMIIKTIVTKILMNMRPVLLLNMSIIIFLVLP